MWIEGQLSINLDSNLNKMGINIKWYLFRPNSAYKSLNKSKIIGPIFFLQFSSIFRLSIHFFNNFVADYFFHHRLRKIEDHRGYRDNILLLLRLVDKIRHLGFFGDCNCCASFGRRNCRMFPDLSFAPFSNQLLCFSYQNFM
jgi:hypothetical protein